MSHGNTSCASLQAGLVVSLFAVLGDVLRPKKLLPGCFGAAPSVALDDAWVSPIGSMVADYVSLGSSLDADRARFHWGFYSFVVVQLLMRRQWSAAVRKPGGRG